MLRMLGEDEGGEREIQTVRQRERWRCTVENKMEVHSGEQERW